METSAINPEFLTEWREEFEMQLLPATETTTDVMGKYCLNGLETQWQEYVCTRAEQFTEIAELKAKLAEVMPLAKFGAMSARKWTNDAYNKVIYEDLDDELIEAIVGGVFLDEGIAPNIEATIEQLLKG